MYDDLRLWLTLGVFAMSVLLLMWRPGGINESVPTGVGAAVLIVTGVVGYADLVGILQTVGGAAVTILSTIVMSIVLDSIGYFRWVAGNLIEYSKGSGIKLYWLIAALCFMMTIFFNNDGSILITTPIIIQICAILQLKPHQKIPYLMSGALIATASSAPIGVSNLANLIALHIVGLDLNRYALLMFVPSMLGIGCMALLLYVLFRRALPLRIRSYPMSSGGPSRIPHGYYSRHMVKRWMGKDDPPRGVAYHPLMETSDPEEKIDWSLFRICIAIVVLSRAGFFFADSLGVPLEAFAIVGAVLLLAVRWIRTGNGALDVLGKTPWHIILFAFSVYVIVVALDHVGLTKSLIVLLGPYMMNGEGHAIAAAGLLLTVMSNLINNLPSVMIGTLSLTEMGLDTHTLQVAYLANIIGSDIGSLLTPMGTLASLIWMFLLRKNHIRFTWSEYIKTAVIVIPVGLAVSLTVLFYWTKWLS